MNNHKGSFGVLPPTAVVTATETPISALFAFKQQQLT